MSYTVQSRASRAHNWQSEDDFDQYRHAVDCAKSVADKGAYTDGTTPYVRIVVMVPRVIRVMPKYRKGKRVK